jgi:DNA mismatch repair ATPase MutS
MFKSPEFYIIVGNNGFIIKKENDDQENTIGLHQFIPNIPPYHHLFDKDKKEYIKDITNQIKRLRIKKAAIIFPDDSIDLEVDKRILIEFFMQCGVKKIQVNFQCFLLSLENKRYISVSKTTRTIVMQYIAYNKSISKKYYDKEYTDMEQLALDMKNLHTDCEYGMIPVYINNINNDMERFKSVGRLISLYDIISNIMNYEADN